LHKNNSTDKSEEEDSSNCQYRNGKLAVRFGGNNTTSLGRNSRWPI
jgi:hypothetical protein